MAADAFGRREPDFCALVQVSAGRIGLPARTCCIGPGHRTAEEDERQDDQASQAMRDWSQVSEQWAQGTQGRVRDMAAELRNQGERAVSTVSQQVEHNPLTSLAVAFALGCVFGTLIRR